MARRISRKSIKQDEFIEGAFEAGVWIEKHWKTVAAGVGAALALLLIVAMWSWWSGRRSDEVGRLLAEGIQLYSGPQSGASGGGRYSEALPIFEKAARLGKSLPSGKVAAFYQGATLLRLGRAKEAIPILEEVSGSGADRALTDTARTMLAEAYAKAGETDKAAAAYRKIADESAAFFPPDMALLQLSKLYEERGRPQEARQVLQEIVTKYPQGPAAADARARLEGKKTAQ